MKAQRLHSWTATPEQARIIQLDLATRVSRRNDIGEVRLIAGVDISAPRGDGRARSAAVVLTYPELELAEVKVIEQAVTFPYIPGLLSFRESPLVISACQQLRMEPDLVLVDGQGIAHPRRLGLASHLGVLWDKPVIGCAKSKLCGSHEEVAVDRGSCVNVVDRGEVIGTALRTRRGVKPVYVSIGHKVDLEAAVEWVLACCRGRRLPEPTRLAHLAAGGQLGAS